MLNKILLFADIEAFAYTGKSISGATYIKQKHGPVPVGIHETVRSMVADGDVYQLEVERFGYIQKRLYRRKLPDLSMFTGPEVATVCEAIGKFGRMTAAQVSEISHGRAWECAAIGEKIPYQAFLLSNKGITPGDEDWAGQMIDEYGESWGASSEERTPCSMP